MPSSIETGECRLNINKCLMGTETGHQTHRQLLFHVDEYKEVRDEIHYEYMLMSNRINWLLASQTFLFTALAIATPKGTDAELDISSNFFYKVAPVIGLCSCWLISSAIVANILRIWDWKRIQCNLSKKIKYITPKLPQDGLSSFGLLPPVGLPLLFFTMWGYVLFARLDFFPESRTIIAIVFAVVGIMSVWSSAFCFYSLNEETINRIFKRATLLSINHRRLTFLITFMLFLGLIFYSIFS